MTAEIFVVQLLIHGTPGDTKIRMKRFDGFYALGKLAKRSGCCESRCGYQAARQ